MTVRTDKFGGTDFSGESLASADLNDTFGFVADTFVSVVPTLDAVSTADPTGIHKTTTTSSVDIPGINLSVGVSTPGVKVLLMLNCVIENERVNDETSIKIKNDTSTESSQFIFCNPQTSAALQFPGSVLWLDTPGVGTSVYKGQFSTGTSGSTAVVINPILIAVELG